MKIARVAQMKPLARLLYWIRERHEIAVRRAGGQAPPWTDDEVLQSYFFTHPYREHDKVTVWLRENVRKKFEGDDGVCFATTAFRWFNLPSTGHLLMGEGMEGWARTWSRKNLLRKWDEQEAVNRLLAQWQDGANPVFTGAYMIKAGNGPRGCKIPQVCRSITLAQQRMGEVVEACKTEQSLQAAWKVLKSFHNLGGFMAYEVACDLRYTHLLTNAQDVDTWANPGPGALRGLHRLQGGIPGKGPLDSSRFVKRGEAITKMIELLGVVRKKLSDMPRFELREIEHSLCEGDKYERALDLHVRGINSGRLKRRYRLGQGVS
jgi:hypothetical protein